MKLQTHGEKLPKKTKKRETNNNNKRKEENTWKWKQNKITNSNEVGNW